MINKEVIGENIKTLREGAHLTQEQLGRMFNKSYVCVSTWESGRTAPSNEIIDRLCIIFNCKKEKILGIGYEGKVRDMEKERLCSIFDALSPDARHLLLVRARELELLERENAIEYLKVS